ncbi:CTP synthase 2-like [Anneissia japonica]|uniref:CTP synthase 2-like n=1 Tax=Anneissia japonica TaxID=1529436 RepID=UPI001425AA86|nr:CTP synthase 2-like [Anneissia japonica]
MKYILVTGGVISGIGKGIIASSVGTLLKACGIGVTSIKIDPYLNIDAGTFSPYEHGEVYVLDDGGEVDLDLGNYERFMDVTLHRDNNITTGKIYQSVISKERKGDYLGKTVQVVPHVTDAVQEWVERVSKIPVDGDDKEPEVCIIELGGTIGDIEGMAFVEAFRQFQFRVNRQNFLNIHVSLVPQPKATGEQKTKPTQSSVRELRGLGLSPDLVVCRSSLPIHDAVREKVSNFCHVANEQVICVHDCTSVYRVPLLLAEQNLIPFFKGRLGLDLPLRPGRSLSKWKELADRYDRNTNPVKIALVGKYIKLEDAYISVNKALMHSALVCNYRLEVKYVDSEELEDEMREKNPVKYHEAWQNLCGSDGVLVPGGFGVRGIEGMVKAAQWARVNKKPYLGICLGLQVAVIEFARNVLGMKKANSSEFVSENDETVVIEMPEHNPGDMGGTMRLGKRKTFFNQHKSVTRKLYNDVEVVEERHRHRYEVDPSKVEEFEGNGLKFVGRSEDGKRMEIMELSGHPYFVAVQYHPEYLSRPLKPSPPYLGFILAAIGRLTSFITSGCRLSPRSSFSDGETSDTEEELMTFHVSNALRQNASH